MPPLPPDQGAPLKLSKSRYVAGLQCHKQLWWRVHDPDAAELSPTPALRNLFAQGLAVGERARQYVPGGALIDLPFYQFDNKVSATRDLLRRDPPVVYEASFLADDTYAAVDILERGPRGYGVIEVKASNSVKPEHIPDVAVQVHVLRKCGLPVERAVVMHLNPECRHPDLSNLFVREDVTAQVEGVLIGVPDELAAQLRMLRGPLPDVPIGEHCTKPYDCPFLDRCWRLPQHHVSTLYRIERRKVLEYEADGYATIYDLPTDLELSAIHARQVKAVTTGRPVVEPALAGALVEFTSPLAFLDFETVSLAIPRYAGCRPWENTPVQFSCHTEGRGGKLVHHEWIADGPEDPRPGLAAALVRACAGARRVVAYYASFEGECLKQLARAVPELARELDGIRAKLVDLLPAVRNNVYHPDFGGSFSLKHVLPALVPSLSYGDLEINEGETASVELQRLMFAGEELSAEERARLREALLAYCKRDTWAMVKLLERLRGLVGAEQLELF
jgi:predicted RecB family nuclease